MIPHTQVAPRRGGGQPERETVLQVETGYVCTWPQKSKGTVCSSVDHVRVNRDAAGLVSGMGPNRTSSCFTTSSDGHTVRSSGCPSSGYRRILPRPDNRSTFAAATPGRSRTSVSSDAVGGVSVVSGATPRNQGSRNLRDAPILILSPGLSASPPAAVSSSVALNTPCWPKLPFIALGRRGFHLREIRKTAPPSLIFPANEQDNKQEQCLKMEIFRLTHGYVGDRSGIL